MIADFLQYTPKPITVEEVYNCVPEIPAGYKVIGFRPPNIGEAVLNSRWHSVSEWVEDNQDQRPRLILVKTRPRQWLVTEDPSGDRHWFLFVDKPIRATIKEITA